MADINFAEPILDCDAIWGSIIKHSHIFQNTQKLIPNTFQLREIMNLGSLSLQMMLNMITVSIFGSFS